MAGATHIPFSNIIMAIFFIRSPSLQKIDRVFAPFHLTITHLFLQKKTRKKLTEKREQKRGRRNSRGV